GKRPLGPEQRAAQPFALDRLQQIVGHRTVERLSGILVECGDKDHKRRVGSLGNCLDHVEPVAVAHLDVEQYEVGPELIDLRQRLGAAGGLANLFGLRNGLEQQLQALPRKHLIVDREDAQRVHAASNGRNRRTRKLPSGSRPAVRLDRPSPNRSARRCPTLASPMPPPLSAGWPLPLSTTSISNCPSIRWAPMPMVAGGGAPATPYLTAFSTIGCRIS